MVQKSKQNLASQLQTPISRFLLSFVTYVYFLALVFIQAFCPYQRCNSGLRGVPRWTISDEHCNERGPPNIGKDSHKLSTCPKKINCSYFRI